MGKPYRSSPAQLANLTKDKPFYDELKSVILTTRLTPTAKQRLREIADDYDLSVSELFEKIARNEFELIRKSS
jgi:DNA-binding GntR family transcriptional regulator